MPADANDGENASNDEVMRKSLKPDPTNEEVIQAIASTYKHEPSNVKIRKELESYDDRNYLIEISTQGGNSNDAVVTKYLCKVYNGVESAKYIECSKDENGDKALSSLHLYSRIWNHVNQSKYGVTTSSPIPISDNTGEVHASIHELPVTSKSHSPTKLVLQLLKWVEGHTMSSVNSLPIETLIQAGTYLAKVCTALDDLTNEDAIAKKSADRYHAWDGRNTLDVQNFVHCIEDEKRRGMVQSVLDAFRSELTEGENRPKFRMGILQGDFNDANILLDAGGNVSGVIDFGDTTLSWRILDLTIAMAYSMMTSYGKTGRSISAAAAVLRGFHSQYPLTKEERKYLRLLIACRLSCSATLGAYSYQQNPQNKYLLLHAEPAWRTLELVWGSNKVDGVIDAIENMFNAACDGCAMDIADISFPDPAIPDALSVARSSDAGAPPKKRPKVDSMEADQPVITFVTGNRKKLEEVKRILSAANDVSKPLPFVISNQKIDLPELQGDPLKIAREKCALAAKEIGGAVITEDTSLCFTALNNLPGPYIKWFLDSCGHKGLNDMISFTDDKSGYAQTVVGFCAGPGEDVTVFDGRTMGTIVPPRGSLDFGWDPVFQPKEGGGLTYAEMSKEAKDAISHRRRAFEKLRSYLGSEADSIKAKIGSVAN